MNILNSLAEIHSNNIIHCDLKPDNFLLFKDDFLKPLTTIDLDDQDISIEYEDKILKITDFGLSQIIQENNTKVYIKNKLGSYSYSAPEMYRVFNRNLYFRTVI